MGIAFFLGACSYGLLTVAGHGGWTFVVCAGLIFFTWGEIFSLFPSLCTDTFGPKYAAANASCLYTAKGTAALLVPFANVLQTATGGWGTVFVVAGISNSSSRCWRWRCCDRCAAVSSPAPSRACPPR